MQPQGHVQVGLFKNYEQGCAETILFRGWAVDYFFSLNIRPYENV